VALAVTVMVVLRAARVSMTDGASGLPAAWRTAPVLVKAFVIAPLVGIATEWAYSAHARSHPTPFVIAALLALLLTAAVIGRHIWAWAIIAVFFVVAVTGVLNRHHWTHRPLALGIGLDLLYVLLLFSPPMLRWVGVSQRWLSRTGSGD
jgi:hypothetical protein